MKNTELIFENLDFDPLVVEEIKALRSGYCACGSGNRIYKILDASKSYRITVPASEPVRARLFHDIVKAMLLTNLLCELFGTPLKLSVYDALEDVKEDMILLCEEWIDYFNCKLLMKPEHIKCIEIFTLIMGALASEERIDVIKTFEILGIK